MFSTLKIPRRLGLSFVAICASAALMMAVFAANLFQISRLTERSDQSRTVHAETLTLETSILRENSQLRGFLVTGDASYLKSYGEARDEFDKTSGDLATRLTDPAQQAQLQDAVSGTNAWRQEWSDSLVNQIKAGQLDDARERVRAAGKAVLVTKPVLALRAIRDAQKANIEANDHSQTRALWVASITLVIGGMLLIGLAVWLAMALSKAIARPITLLTATMTELAAGRLDIDVPETVRPDELGDMARAVVVFRDAGRSRVQAEQDQSDALGRIGVILGRLAQTDLTVRLGGLPPAYQSIERDFNEALERLGTAMATVGTSVRSIRTNSSEISSSASELQDRSENQASTLARQAAAMEQITESVRESARLIDNADHAMRDARDEAQKGGHVVHEAIAAMNGIDRASREIEEIIAVIDGIAFQTNLLALNAGVEAARAGDAGKGFAVVANEVRALAQRSANAAHDVKIRISTAGDNVLSGVKLVNATGEALERIISSVAVVSDTMSAISGSAREQSAGLEQINMAIGQMDSMTQQNAAMVEETNAAAHMLGTEAMRLFEAFQAFRIDSQAAPAAAPAPSRGPALRAVAIRPAAGRAAAAPTQGNLAVDNNWAEF
jgi:methyl-accepting chemotaxis protein